MNGRMQLHIPYTAVKRKADAWMGRARGKVSCEINFNHHLNTDTPPRILEKIDADLKKAEEEILRLLREVVDE
jgi:type I restriction enzyme M protein